MLAYANIEEKTNRIKIYLILFCVKVIDFIEKYI